MVYRSRSSGCPGTGATLSPPYMPGLQDDVNQRLQAAGVPTLDLLIHYDPKLFDDLTHLNRQDGAPVFTKEVDAWLASFAKPSK
ncbi:hypothetical protein LJK88_00880 [Paenibacillus sp. P26]|nr:hypothetical protein LJK88_00880 [Paenibacillus sp. P26]